MNRGKKRLLIIVSTACLAMTVRVQAQERLFCASCGKQSDLKALYCFACSHRLDKSALVSRIKNRLQKADSLNQQVLLTAAEISVLVEELAESRANDIVRSGGIVRPRREKTQVEKTLDFVFPIVVGSAAVYFLGQQFNRTD